MDYCMAHPGSGNYHYHFFSYGSEYNGCLMSCREDAVSGIVGVAYDGFPFYGPMQYYSASEGKIYKNPDNCNDCELIQINSVHTDACGGIEVADGDETEGGQYRNGQKSILRSVEGHLKVISRLKFSSIESIETVTRYIVSNLFPYNLQCWRGDMSATEMSRDGTETGDYSTLRFRNKCGIDSDGQNGSKWDEEEHGWRGGNCERFDWKWVQENGCIPGNCPYRHGLGLQIFEILNQKF